MWLFDFECIQTFFHSLLQWTSNKEHQNEPFSVYKVHWGLYRRDKGKPKQFEEDERTKWTDLTNLKTRQKLKGGGEAPHSLSGEIIYANRQTRSMRRVNSIYYLNCVRINMKSNEIVQQIKGRNKNNQHRKCSIYGMWIYTVNKKWEINKQPFGRWKIETKQRVEKK
jgi:hypothetical protein